MFSYAKIKMGIFLGILILSLTAFAAEALHTPLLLEVTLNQQDLKEIVMFLENPDGDLYVGVDHLKKWGLKIPAIPPLIYQDESYYQISDIQDSQFKIDRVKMRIDIQLPAQAFASHHINGY